MNIYKEAGYTSHDVVAKLRGILKQKRIGHTGTLDPDAVGALPVCLGTATKLCELLTEHGKEYDVYMRLGVATDTQDLSGRTLAEAAVVVDEREVEAAVMGFVGGYDQIPPMYSALKVNGKRLYELAREGKEVERKPRRVEIPYIKILEISLPMVHFVVGCSKGTYIRSLCADIGEKLGCGAAMAQLKRTKAGGFCIEGALTLSQVEELAAAGTLAQHILPPDKVLMEYSGAIVKPEAEKALLNGSKLFWAQLEMEPAMESGIRLEDGSLLRVYLREAASDREFKALYCFCASENCFKPFKMFL